MSEGSYEVYSIAGWSTSASTCIRTPHHHSHTTTLLQHTSNQSNTTHEITQHISRKLLRMDVLTSETCWALSKEIIKQITSSWSRFTQRIECLKEQTSMKTTKKQRNGNILEERMNDVSSKECRREHRMTGWLYRKLFNELAPTTECICVKLCVRDFRCVNLKIIGRGPQETHF